MPSGCYPRARQAPRETVPDAEWAPSSLRVVDAPRATVREMEEAEAAHLRVMRLLEAALAVAEELRLENVRLRLRLDWAEEQAAAVAAAAAAAARQAAEDVAARLAAQAAPGAAPAEGPLLAEVRELAGLVRALAAAAPPAAAGLVNLPPGGAPLAAIVTAAMDEALRQARGCQKDAAALLRVSSRVFSYRLRSTEAGQAVQAPRLGRGGRRPRAAAAQYSSLPEAPVA